MTAPATPAGGATVSEAEVEAALVLYTWSIAGMIADDDVRRVCRTLEPRLRALASAQPDPAEARAEVERLREAMDLALLHAADLKRADQASRDRAVVVEAELAAWKAHPAHAQRVKAGVRLAITWLRARVLEMGDPRAKVVLEVAADHLGKAMTRDRSHPEDAVIADAIGATRNAAVKAQGALAAAEVEVERLREELAGFRSGQLVPPIVADRIDYLNRALAAALRGDGAMHHNQFATDTPDPAADAPALPQEPHPDA